MSTPEQLAIAAMEVCQRRGLDLVSELGSGAFKRAYLVRSPDGQEFALKLAPLVGSVDRLVRETDALRGCAHPSIATLVEAYSDRVADQSLWIALERFVPGGTLERKLIDGPLTAQQTISIAKALAEVLEHLDQRNLVHRDIKPANILFASDGTTPILTDFGIVRMLDQPSLTRDFVGFGPGTPAYAAPEQLNNEKPLIDWRTDQFGLAVVLSECVLRRHPFLAPGATLRDAILAVAAKKTIPDQTREELRSHGLGMLETALAPWPIARYRKPGDLIRALQS